MALDYNQNLWKAVVEELKSTLPERLHESLFQNTGILLLSAELIQIYAPNPAAQQKISALCMDDIQKAMFKCSGIQCPIEMVSLSKESQSTFDFEDEVVPIPKPLSALEADIDFESEERSLTFAKPNLNPDYTFENFVVGDSNEMAYKMAWNAATTPGKGYNPLFIYGPAGLGKTHLMHAICHKVLNANVGHTVAYLSCEDFINEFVQAVDQSKLSGFRYKYRYVNVLLIDDIHFLSGKDRCQEEFFHTFNLLYNSQRQIVISSDTLPSDMPDLTERLTTRLKWGVTVTIEPPSLDTRIAIIQRKADLRGKKLSEDVCRLMVSLIRGSIRELEGAVNHLVAFQDAHGVKEVTVDFAQKTFGKWGLCSIPNVISPNVISPKVISQNVITHEAITQETELN